MSSFLKEIPVNANLGLIFIILAIISIQYINTWLTGSSAEITEMGSLLSIRASEDTLNPNLLTTK